MSIIIGAGGPSDKDSIPLATRKGRHIPNERRHEKSPAQLRDAVELWQKERPNAELRSITAVYNCMGLVFASRRTCVDIEHLRMILTDDGYRKLEGEADARIGDIVIYKNRLVMTHVGIIIDIQVDLTSASREIMVLSKWGFDGEYIHNITDVPDAYGLAAEFWTDRKVKP